jgi:hypothetical protein
MSAIIVLNYEELLEKSKMPSLKVRRLRRIAIETFKIIYKESTIYLHDPNVHKLFCTMQGQLCYIKFIFF